MTVRNVLRELCGMCRDAPNADGLRAYERLLSDIDPDCLQKAVHRHLFESKGRWFPAVGELRQLAIECEHGTVPTWEIAWDHILKAVRYWDLYDQERAFKAREMLGPTLMCFVRFLGGFDRLKDATDTGISVMRGQFRDAWKNRKEEIERDRLLPQYLRPQKAIPAEMAPTAIPEKPQPQPQPQRRIEQRPTERIEQVAPALGVFREPIERPQLSGDEQLKRLAEMQAKREDAGE